MVEETPTEKGDRLQTVVAILIALVALLGAVVAWRAALASDEAGDADFAGLNATLNSEQTRALNSTSLYEHYRVYTVYLRNNELGNLLADDLDKQPDEAEAAKLEQQKSEAWDTASANQPFFPSRYLDREGNYNVQRELGEEWAEASQEKDLNPGSHFQNADQMRAKSNWLIGILIILGFSLLFYTIGEGLNPALKLVRYGLVGGGTLFMLVSLLVLILVEIRL
jgi:hypothetical protein